MHRAHTVTPRPNFTADVESHIRYDSGWNNVVQNVWKDEVGGTEPSPPVPALRTFFKYEKQSVPELSVLEPYVMLCLLLKQHNRRRLERPGPKHILYKNNERERRTSQSAIHTTLGLVNFALGGRKQLVWSGRRLRATVGLHNSVMDVTFLMGI